MTFTNCPVTVKAGEIVSVPSAPSVTSTGLPTQEFVASLLAITQK